MSEAEKMRFFTHTRIGRAVYRVAGFFAFMAGLVCSLFVIWSIETRFFPVITDFKITAFERVGDRYIIEGQFNKRRPCELLATNVLAVPRQMLAPSRLIHQIKPFDIAGGNAPTGRSIWGPYSIPFPHKVFENEDLIAWVEVRSVHRCHALWNQETTYTRLNLSEVPR